MQQISKKDQRALNSAKMLRILSTKDYSESTIDMIRSILRPLREHPIKHGKMVIRILDILENSDTEENVIRLLEYEGR